MGTTRKTLSIFWRENMRHSRLFLGTASSWLVGMILQKLILPLVIAHAVNTLIQIHANGTSDYWPIFAPYLWAFIAVGLAGQVLIDMALVWLSKLETTVRPALQVRIFAWLIDHSLTFHANTFSGALVNQVNRFTSAYIQVTDTFILPGLRMFTNVIMAIVVTAFFSLPIAGAMLVWAIFFIWLNIALTRRRIKYAKAAAAADSVLTAHLADAIGNIAAVKAFGQEKTEAKLHDAKSIDRAQKKYRSWIEAIKNDALVGLMMTLLYFATLVLSIHAVMTNALSLGMLLLVQVYVVQLITELWGLSGMTKNFEQALSDAEEMTEILEQAPSVQDPAKPQKVSLKSGAVRFRSVLFTHDGSKKALFRDFSLYIKPGEKVGLVGHSGSGKTTLTRLLLRFNDIGAGEITIDDQSIRDVRQAELRKHIAYVPQEPLLFHRSLRENIAYGKPDATDAEVRQAAKLAHAAEFIDSLPQGYDTLVGERGVKLSGGQRQRIAIARAILKDAPLLVLDEATSALDSESEKLIQDALNKLMKGRTTIVIAHRLSTIQKMDRIIVMDDGRIIEEGSHSELLALKGEYAKLWSHQSGGFLEE